MPSFNQVTLIAHLTRDPSLKYLPSQTAIVEFGVACNRKFKTAGGEEREEVAFIECSCFGKRAEVINKYFQKGKAIFLTGRLKYDSWEDKNGGGKRSKLSVVVEDFQFIGSKSDGDGEREEQPARAPSSKPKQTANAPFANDEQHFNSDDIPFAWEGRSTQPL